MIHFRNSQVVLQFRDSYHKEHQEHRSISFWHFFLFNNEKVVLRQLMDEERGSDGKNLIEMKYWQVTNDSGCGETTSQEGQGL